MHFAEKSHILPTDATHESYSGQNDQKTLWLDGSDSKVNRILLILFK